MNGVTFAQIMVVSEQRCAALPAELAGCMVLAVADALSSLSLKVGPQELILLEDGTIRLYGGVPSDDRTAEVTLRDLLGRILLSACSVTPALLRAARRPPQGSMSELVRELEVALIPTNRGAARRALARLCREVAQSLKQNPKLQETVDALQIDDSEHVEAQPELPPTCAPSVDKEPEILEEWIEVSPVFLDIEVTSASPSQACDTVAATGSIDIPDLEIPNYATPARPPETSSWQPIEHTQKLCIQSGYLAQTSIGVTGAPPQASVVLREPKELSRAPESDVEYIELSQGDLRELTAKLPTAAVAEQTAALQVQPEQVIALGVPFEHQTAEPFLLVMPSQGQDLQLGSTLPECESLDQASLNDATQLEPCAGESEDTVLDAVTSIDDEELEYVADLAEVALTEIDDDLESESPYDATYLHEEGLADAGIELPEELEDQVVGPHHYVAPARFSRKASDVTDRVAQFSVAQTESSDELTRGLRNLAGVENEMNFEPTATPPPTVYAEEQGAPESIPSGAFVKTLIGLGVTGLAIAMAQMSSGRVASVSAAANGVPFEAISKPCKAILNIAEVPVGSLIRVTQGGLNAKFETVQTGHVPVRIAGLTCGEPAELLVKLSDRGWYRIPIDGSRLSADENPEPVRISAHIKP